MRFWRAFLLAAATMFSAATAMAADQRPAPPPTGGEGVPDPIAGAGLPVLAIAGGYYLVRRWRKR